MTEDHAKENALRELLKSHRAARAARALLALDLGDDAVTRAYFAAFHAAVALLVSAGLQARSHAGVHELFFRHFVENGPLSRSISKDLASLQRYREQADYTADAHFDQASAEEEIDRSDRVRAAIIEILDERGISLTDLDEID